MSFDKLAGIVIVVVVALAGDARADRAALQASYDKLSTAANGVAAAAKESDDRGTRKKFAPAAADLGDDFAAIARRLGKDVPLKSIVKDATEAERAAAELVELADEADDKEERKALRQAAQIVAYAAAAARKELEAANKSDAKQPAAAERFSGRIFNDSNGDDCGISENMKFQISRNGSVVHTSPQLVFPGRNYGVVLDKGTYLVTLLDTTNTFKGQRTLEVGREGWTLKSGCVNED